MEFRQTFCIDYNGWITGSSTVPPPKQIDFDSQTIPELIYTKATNDRVAAVFDLEKSSYTFRKIVEEMEVLAAGLLSTGLKPNDRILVCGSNHSHVMICALAAARAGLVFSLVNPNFASAESLNRALYLGEFRAVICFKALACSDYLNSLLLEFIPELMKCPKGKLKSEACPKLTHVILAEEDHKHAGTYTLSEIFGRSTKERIAKLPKYDNWSSHKLACLQFTLGTASEPKLVALSHYQLLNGARAVVTAFGIKMEHVLACALPIFRIPIFSLVCLSPFLTECRSVFPEPSPLPKNLFACVSKYKCTTLLSNGAALRLLLKISLAQRVKLTALENVLLIGDRVNKEVLKLIKTQAENVKIVAVGYLLTETGSIPILGDQNSDFTRNVGRAIAGYELHLIPLDGSQNAVPSGQLGKLLIRVYFGSTFMGYAPDTKGKEKWVDTGDVAKIDADGNVEIFCQEEDLIYDKNNCLVEHWHVERLLNQSELIKGIQVISLGRGKPVIAVCVLKNNQSHMAFVKDELRSMCRSHRFIAPDLFAFVDDFPSSQNSCKMRVRSPLVAIGCGQFALSLMQVMFQFYYVKVYLNIFHVPKLWFNVAQFLFMIWNAVNDPLFGFLQDRPGSWLNSRTLAIRYFAPFIGISFVFMWLPWDTSGSAWEGLHLILALFFYDAFFSALGVSWSALFADTTQNPALRVSAMKYTQLSILLSVNIISITEKASKSLEFFGIFQTITVIVACIGTCMLFVAGSFDSSASYFREKDDRPLLSESEYDTKSTRSIWQMSREIVVEKDFLRIIAANFLHNARSVAHLNFASIATEILIPQTVLPKGSLSLSIFYGICTLGPQLLIIGSEKLVAKHGSYRVMVLSYMFSVLSGCMILFSSSAYVIMLFMVIDSITVHSIAPLFNIVISDFIDDDTKRYNRRNGLSSLVFSLNALFVKPAQSLAPVIIVYLLNFYGYQDYLTSKTPSKDLYGTMKEMLISITVAVDSIRAWMPCSLLSASMIPFATGALGIGATSWVTSKHVFQKLDNTLYRAYMRLCLFVFENLSSAQLKLYGDVEVLKSKKENVLVLSNHQTNEYRAITLSCYHMGPWHITHMVPEWYYTKMDINQLEID
ncbi:hypothetical protein WR25_06149 [Diploscapter pachys]|uniref:AMP-dependent synthetase/ligase domain-containing protein n=1 Tax=Diploscapter pachys TaxID=2018661 RepID=A0A2A2JAT8_9BILA|nr:hypothetical protein WR25_06149 [Diploscapter pachys]